MRSSNTVSRFLPHLQQFVTLFFSFTMVGYFKLFSDTFHLSTKPSIDLRDGSQDLILVSFVVTLFWIVTAWLGYNMLVERHPYTMDLSRFFFDVVRFSLLNFTMSLAFTAATIGSFQIYIFAIALWHALMSGWYLVQASGVRVGEGQREARKDATSHGIRLATYLALGLIYLFVVALRADQPDAQVLRYVIAGAVFVVMVVWNVGRIADLRSRALADAVPVPAS